MVCAAVEDANARTLTARLVEVRSDTLRDVCDFGGASQVLNGEEVVMEGKIKPYSVENKDKEPQVLENR